MRKYTALIVVAAVLGLACGCAAAAGLLDAFFGVDPAAPAAGTPGATAGTPVNPATPAPSDAAGTLLGTFLPGAAGILALLRWGWTEIRRRKLDGSFKAAVAGVTEAVDAAKGKPVSKAVLYKALTAASEVYANRDFFETAVDKVKAEVRAKKKT